jgi:hypothetical protein
MFERIVKAFDPIVLLLQAVAYPLAYIAIAVGILLYILDQQRMAMRFIRSAIIGYLFMQILPGVMLLLHDVGAAMKQ